MPPTIVETDLKEILGSIQKDLKDIREDLSDLKINQARMEERLSAQINLVDEKLSGQIGLVDEEVSGLGKRLEFQEFINRSILAGLILLVLGGAAKYLGIMPKL
jgi:hypothetical protein